MRFVRPIVNNQESTLLVTTEYSIKVGNRLTLHNMLMVSTSKSRISIPKMITEP